MSIMTELTAQERIEQIDLVIDRANKDLRSLGADYVIAATVGDLAARSSYHGSAPNLCFCVRLLTFKIDHEVLPQPVPYVAKTLRTNQ